MMNEHVVEAENTNTLAFRLYMFRLNLKARGERLLMAIVWRLPHAVINWCAIRMWASATTGQFSGETPVGMSMDVVIKRWENRQGGDQAFRQ